MTREHSIFKISLTASTYLFISTAPTSPESACHCPGGTYNVEVYQARLRRLLRPARAKRGLINAVGEISKNLFGGATEKDVEKIKSTMNELVAESNQRRFIFRDLILCVNQNTEQQERIVKKVDVLA